MSQFIYILDRIVGGDLDVAILLFIFPVIVTSVFTLIFFRNRIRYLSVPIALIFSFISFSSIIIFEPRITSLGEGLPLNWILPVCIGLFLSVLFEFWQPSHTILRMLYSILFLFALLVILYLIFAIPTCDFNNDGVCLAEKAFASEDPKICKQGVVRGWQDGQEACISSLQNKQLHTKKLKEETCVVLKEIRQFMPEEASGNCYFELAKQNQNIIYCNSAGEFKDPCLYELTKNKNVDLAFCKSLTETFYINQCISDYIKSIPDSSKSGFLSFLCAGLHNPSEQISCINLYLASIKNSNENKTLCTEFLAIVNKHCNAERSDQYTAFCNMWNRMLTGELERKYPDPVLKSCSLY